MSQRRSHPPSLIRRAEREIADEGLIVRGMRVLVAVSGGPDSMALMHVLSVLRAKVGFALVAHTVNHGLRVEAEEEVALVKEHAGVLGVPLGVSRLSVEPGGNLQARARDARLAALREAAGACGAERIALGHHADDRAETVLQRMLRGAGPVGLAVLSSRAGELIRPLIRARRSDVMAHVRRHSIPYVKDPSNEDTRFTRARVRAELLPMMESLSPRVVEHLCNLADDLGALSLPRAEAGRAHLRELGRAALVERGGVRVSMPGGKVAKVDLETRRIVIETAEDVKGTRHPTECSVGASHLEEQ